VRDECRMSLVSWMKIFLDAKMKLLIAEREPDAAADREVRRLYQFFQPQQGTVEGAGLRFAAARHGELQMIEPDDGAHAHTLCIFTSTGGPLLIVW
jgi:hypothetical protein